MADFCAPDAVGFLGMLRPLLVAVGCLGMLDCRQPAPPVIATCPTMTWQSISTSRGRVGLCLPPHFRVLDSAGWWARGRATDSDFATLSIDIFDSAKAADEWGSHVRPRSLRDPVDSTELEAVFAESVATRSLTVDGKSIEVETARLSGGIGFHRQPFLRGVWHLPGSRWALAQGWASRARDLNLIRDILGTLRMATEQ